MSRRRVAITGIGLVTALGATREATWQRLIAGRCGIRPVTVFDTAGYRSRVAAEVATAPIVGAADAARAPALVAQRSVRRRRRARSPRPTPGC